MTAVDNDKLQPDKSTDKTAQNDTPNQPDVEVEYGILVFVDSEGKQDLQILGKERANLHDLMGLIDLAQRKLSVVWDSRNNPVIQALQRDIGDLKRISAQNHHAIGAMTEILQGIHTGMQILGGNIVDPDTDNEEDVDDASETRDPLQTE